MTVMRGGRLFSKKAAGLVLAGVLLLSGGQLQSAALAAEGAGEEKIAGLTGRGDPVEWNKEDDSSMEKLIFSDLGISFCVPKNWEQVGEEPNEDQKKQGYIVVYGDHGDTTQANILTALIMPDTKAGSLEAFYQGEVTNGGASGGTELIINGVPAIGYDIDTDSSSCLCFQDKEGRICKLAAGPIRTEEEEKLVIAIFRTLETI